jgi:hypothetical protein
MSIHQPWATAIVLGLKDVENRTWSTRYRGPLLIHASRRYDREGEERMRSMHPDAWEAICSAYPDGPPRGAIVGRATLVNVVEDSNSPWAERGQMHWLLADAQRFDDPIPFKGRLGLFEAEV